LVREGLSPVRHGLALGLGLGLALRGPRLRGATRVSLRGGLLPEATAGPHPAGLLGTCHQTINCALLQAKRALSAATCFCRAHKCALAKKTQLAVKYSWPTVRVAIWMDT
jgi:hypothetical protein